MRPHGLGCKCWGITHRSLDVRVAQPVPICWKRTVCYYDPDRAMRVHAASNLHQNSSLVLYLERGRILSTMAGQLYILYCRTRNHVEWSGSTLGRCGTGRAEFIKNFLVLRNCSVGASCCSARCDYYWREGNQRSLLWSDSFRLLPGWQSPAGSCHLLFERMSDNGSHCTVPASCDRGTHCVLIGGL